MHPISLRRRPPALPGLSALLTLTALTTLAHAAHAAHAAPAAHAAGQPDPLNAQASSPSLAWRSAFEHYRAWADSPPLSWRDANAQVERIGGWRAYAREAAQAAQAAKTAQGQAPALLKPEPDVSAAPQGSAPAQRPGVPQ